MTTTRNTEPAPSKGVQRRAAILRAATEVFLEHGFANARLEEVIQRSGGSLSTLYAHFGDKQRLFAAIIQELCNGIVGTLPSAEAPVSKTPEQVLSAFGKAYLGTLLTSESLSLYRVVIGESARFPELGRAVFEAGPAQAAARLEGYLRRETASGVLDVRRPALAATQFLEMVKGDLHFRALLGSEPLPSKKEVGACVREATDTFLSGIARRGRDLPHMSRGPSRSRSDRASSKLVQPR